VADGVREAFGRESAVIHHGVDTERFKPDPGTRVRLRAAQNLSADAPVLVTAAALEERKGVQWVLRALPDILREHPETTYLVLGDGAYRPTLERMSRELGVEKRVRFLGAQAEIVPFYQAADVSLILARGEASSLTALESLACGVPVIAAQQSPFDELLAPEYGVMVNEQDARQVASAINGLLGDDARRRAMGEQGRARILADFTWERVGEEYARLLDENTRV
jgi:phosphatidylinositol alpha-1,6-mannosyltransferase